MIILQESMRLSWNLTHDPGSAIGHVEQKTKVQSKQKAEVQSEQRVKLNKKSDQGLIIR